MLSDVCGISCDTGFHLRQGLKMMWCRCDWGKCGATSPVWELWRMSKTLDQGSGIDPVRGGQQYNWADVVSLPGQRLRRWPGSETTSATGQSAAAIYNVPVSQCERILASKLNRTHQELAGSVGWVVPIAPRQNCPILMATRSPHVIKLSALNLKSAPSKARKKTALACQARKRLLFYKKTGKLFSEYLSRIMEWSQRQKH